VAIKNILCHGVGFDSAGDSTTKFMPTHGFSIGAATVILYPGDTTISRVGPGHSTLIRVGVGDTNLRRKQST